MPRSIRTKACTKEPITCPPGTATAGISHRAPTAPPRRGQKTTTMKRFATLLTAFLLMAGAAPAQDYGQAFTLKIWDNATAPHSNGIETPEREPEPNRLFDVSETMLYIFPADSAKATGQAVVICPGGGYVKLCIDYEGYDMAKWFAANGITAAVLKYRMPNGHPEVPLEDVEQALRIMMGLEAGATGFTSNRVGIVGSSAGGHLAASASTLATPKPAFAILFYPVITAERGKGHQGSFDALLGDARNADTDARYSLQNRVTAQTPPTLLLLSDNDKTVPPVNSILYYEALKRHGVKASMHIYPTGGHGWGIRANFKYREPWQQAVLDWLAEVNQEQPPVSVLLRQPDLPGRMHVGIHPVANRKSEELGLGEIVLQEAIKEIDRQVHYRRNSNWPAGQ